MENGIGGVTFLLIQMLSRWLGNDFMFLVIHMVSKKNLTIIVCVAKGYNSVMKLLNYYVNGCK